MGGKAPEGDTEPEVINDVLRVRTWPDRIVVDLSEDPMGIDYMSLTDVGGRITLSAEHVSLSWAALRQIASLIAYADVTLQKEK